MARGEYIGICGLCGGSGALLAGRGVELWTCQKCGGDGVNATGTAPKFIGKRR